MRSASALLPRLLERRQILLSAALIVLVGGLAEWPATQASRFFALLHFGLFLLWQPIVRPRYRLGLADLLVLGAGLGAFTLALSPGALAVWVMVLAGVVGGRSFVASSLPGRAPYLIALVLLIVYLAMVLMPAALDLPPSETSFFAPALAVLLPAMAFAIALFPVERQLEPGLAGGIDLLSALMLLLVLAVTVLGALALMQLAGLAYFPSLALALTGMAGTLLLLAWAWHPRLGHAGLGVQFSRRMLSSALSFEDWLSRLAAESARDPEPEAFLAAALEDLRRYPGVVGGRWRYRTAGTEGRFGATSEVLERFSHAGLEVELAFVRRPGEGLLWHYDLMVAVLAEFYREKCQTRLLQLRSLEEAVHETGARLTHDVKNLLQSLNALCFAVKRPDADQAALQRLFSSQLPRIAARLEQTLDKLRRPEEAGLTRVPALQWWREACARLDGQGVRMAAEFDGGEATLPAELYDTCLDNLVHNALAKRQLEPGLEICVAFDAASRRLRVSDRGSAIPPGLAGRLMHHPLRSAQGLGVGLYQSARLAERAGHRLALVSNEDGAVVIELYPLADEDASRVPARASVA